MNTSTTRKAKRGPPINSPTYPTYDLDHFSFFIFGRWSHHSLVNIFPFCSSVSSLSVHLFVGFLLHNQQFSLSSVVSLCLCLCLFLCYQSKRVHSLDYQKKQKSSQFLSAANLKIVNQWSLITSNNYQISF